jgi:hypothetical protein
MPLNKGYFFGHEKGYSYGRKRLQVLQPVTTGAALLIMAQLVKAVS